MADTRKCIGSAKFGIEAHEAPVGDFPTQPSQKDGLGRMCKPHWNQYTQALRKASLASKAAGTKLPVGTGTPPVARVATKRAARVAPGFGVFAEPVGATSESPAVKTRRAQLADRIVAAGGVGTDAGQRILEAAGTAAALGRTAQLDQMAEDAAEASIA